MALTTNGQRLEQKQRRESRRRSSAGGRGSPPRKAPRIASMSVASWRTARARGARRIPAPSHSSRYDDAARGRPITGHGARRQPHSGRSAAADCVTGRATGASPVSGEPQDEGERHGARRRLRHIAQADLEDPELQRQAPRDDRGDRGNAITTATPPAPTPATGARVTSLPVRRALEVGARESPRGSMGGVTVGTAHLQPWDTRPRDEVPMPASDAVT
jgi:hypothetical protein